MTHTRDSQQPVLERFSESARRVVFWARFAAGQSGADAIEPEHLLLGLLAEDQRDAEQVMAKYLHAGRMSLPRDARYESFFSGEAAGRLRHKLAESASHGAPKGDEIDMPVADGSQRALLVAQEHAGDSTIGLLHILWGLISDQESSTGKLLRSNGVTQGQVEGAIRICGKETPTSGAPDAC